MRWERALPFENIVHAGDVALRSAEGSPVLANDVQYAIASVASTASLCSRIQSINMDHPKGNRGYAVERVERAPRVTKTAEGKT